MLGVKGAQRAGQPNRAGEGLPADARARLVATTALLGLLTVLHDVDHVRQGRPLPVVLYGVAVAALVSIGTTLLVLTRYPRWAREVAIAQGVSTVVGVGVVHVAPEWSHLADSYASAHADAVSWLIIIAMMCTGLILTVLATQPAGSGPRSKL